MVRGIGVMRRRTDSWLNATQILKVAGVDKGKRTKILEKDIAQGVHEKIQGGYGRYQGTWYALLLLLSVSVLTLDLQDTLRARCRARQRFWRLPPYRPPLRLYRSSPSRCP